jgi:hypothetical protein
MHLRLPHPRAIFTCGETVEALTGSRAFGANEWVVNTTRSSHAGGKSFPDPQKYILLGLLDKAT